MTSKIAITRNQPYVSSQHQEVNLEPGFLFSYLKIYPLLPANPFQSFSKQ